MASNDTTMKNVQDKPTFTIIAICGKRGHGKSCITKHVTENYIFKSLAFARPLKEAVRAVFGFSDDQLYGEAKEQVDPLWEVTPRQVLQVVGTNLFRDELPKHIPQLSDIWVKACINDILKDKVNTIIEDCRFPSELHALRNLSTAYPDLRINVRVLRVIRPHYVSDPAFANHPSETALDDVEAYPPDVIVRNDGTVQELLAKVDSVLSSWDPAKPQITGKRKQC